MSGRASQRTNGASRREAFCWLLTPAPTQCLVPIFHVVAVVCRQLKPPLNPATPTSHRVEPACLCSTAAWRVDERVSSASSLTALARQQIKNLPSTDLRTISEDILTTTPKRWTKRYVNTPAWQPAFLELRNFNLILSIPPPNLKLTFVRQFLVLATGVPGPKDNIFTNSLNYPGACFEPQCVGSERARAYYSSSSSVRRLFFQRFVEMLAELGMHRFIQKVSI